MYDVYREDGTLWARVKSKKGAEQIKEFLKSRGVDSYIEKSESHIMKNRRSMKKMI